MDYPFVKINECTNKDCCNGKHTKDTNDNYIICTWHDVVCKFKNNVEPPKNTK